MKRNDLGADRRPWRARGGAFAAGAVIAALAIGGGPLGAQQAAEPAPQQETRPRGDAEITVAIEGGKKFTACTVYARNQTFELTAPNQASLARALPADERIAFTADARIGEGATAQRFVGVRETAIEPNRVTKVKVTLKPVAQIDAYCRGCHPSKGQKAARGQIVRDLHVSGKELTGRYLQKVREQNAEVERLRREGKPANLPIVAEERIVVVAGKEVKTYYYTCESCHTLHAETPNRKYARAPFIEKSDLCLGCHY